MAVGLPAGAYAVIAKGSNTGLVATAAFNQNAGMLFVSPPSGAPGSSATATGNGYGNGEQVLFTFGGNAIGSCAAAPNGTCSNTFTVPAGNPMGVYTVTATGASTGVTASTTFTQTPGLTLTSYFGKPGDGDMASATYFSAFETVDFTYGGEAIGSCSTDGTGACDIAFTVPMDTPVGTYTVTATGQSSNLSTSVSFVQNKAVLQLTSISGGEGSLETATGYGFVGRETVQFTYDLSVVGTCVASVNGTCALTFNVPAGTPGSEHTISALGLSSRLTANAAFQQSLTGISLATNAGAPLTSLAGTLSGFAPNEQVAIAYAGATIAIANVGSNGLGQFGMTIPINHPTGNYTVNATGQTSGFTASTIFQQNAGLLRIARGTSTDTLDAYGFAANETIQFVGGASESRDLPVEYRRLLRVPGHDHRHRRGDGGRQGRNFECGGGGAVQPRVRPDLAVHHQRRPLHHLQRYPLLFPSG